MMKGKKWLMEATYISDDAKKDVLARVERYKQDGYKNVGVRPASYIGEPAPIVTIFHGPGQTILCSVYKENA